MVINGGFLSWISREIAELFWDDNFALFREYAYNTDINLDILLMLLWNGNKNMG